jgi:hypothetical protein
MINKALFVPQEINGGIGRLTRAGLLRHDNGKFFLTDSGRELVALGRREAAETPRTSVIRAISRHLGAPTWSPEEKPSEADVGELTVVSNEEFDAAAKRYRATFWEMAREMNLLPNDQIPGTDG